MPKLRTVEATFSTGLVINRTSVSRVYTHAYVAEGGRPDGTRWQQTGFSSSAEQAQKNMDAETAWLRKQAGYTLDVAEVVPVTLIERSGRAA